MAMLFDMFGRRKSRYSEEEIKRRLPPGQIVDREVAGAALWVGVAPPAR